MAPRSSTTLTDIYLDTVASLWFNRSKLATTSQHKEDEMCAELVKIESRQGSCTVQTVPDGRGFRTTVTKAGSPVTCVAGVCRTSREAHRQHRETVKSVKR